MTELLDIVLNSRDPRQTQWQLENRSAQIAELDPQGVDSLLVALVETLGDAPQANADTAASIQILIHRLSAKPSGQAWTNARLNAVESLYRNAPIEADLRNQLLHWIAASGDVDAMKLWAELITTEPPEHRLGLVMAFAPLMHKDFDPPPWLQEKLLVEGTSHMQIAPLVFDVFNFWFRSEKVSKHPAEPRLDHLLTLFGQLIGQLGKIEEGNIRKDVDLLTLNLQISDSVSLVVSLCDFFGLLESDLAKPKLHQAMALKHRRVQTEASAALARLGEEEGKEMLISLAEEPVARLRVLNYAEELGFLKDVSLEWQGEIATAESHLAIWLSDPRQVGFAPAEIKLIDNRELNWPSYDHPVQCYLFDYRYGLKDDAPGNVGICGPMTHAFPADLRGLSQDDMYAAFAGWQTVHEEIFVTTIDRAKAAAPDDISALENRMQGIEDGVVEKVELVGNFFGQWILLASGETEGSSATLVVDEEDEFWIGCGNPNAPIDAETVWSIVQGRKLLAHFNDDV
ncbi:hypothetical protein [Mariniblastus fucicola]|uniref:Uncharacterized protein n=1 Tax=Mariniblastus fucicola TaxID=980251 RepID=A0A5B9PFK9_9BACT|nr:hypothetical protein [Mariniblastus fucicola]QEG24339.1 hypothetical protein MFFC18_42580 [Mariniblastus fucicola]